MKTVIEVFRNVHDEIVAEKGPFALFAVFQREDSYEGRWDVIVAASWLRPDRRADWLFMSNRVRAPFKLSEMPVSRVAILDMVAGVSISRTLGVGEYRDFIFNGIPIRNAHIFSYHVAAPKRQAKTKRKTNRKPRQKTLA